MKKIVFGVMIIVFLISSFLSIKIFAFYDIYSTFNTKSLAVHIQNKNTSLSAKDYISDIEKTAEEEKINLKRVIYAPISNGKEQKAIFYVFNGGSNNDRFFSNLPLSWGRQLKSNDESNKFLSNIKSGDVNQVGQISTFDSSFVIEIRPMTAMESHLDGSDYVLSTLNTETAKEFIQKLKRNYGFECSLASTGNSSGFSDENMLLDLAFFGLLFCLSVLTAIAFLYFVIFRFKEIVIRKMFGSSNKKLILKLIIKDTLPLFGISILLSAAATFVYLIFNNGLARFWNFVPIWFLCQALLSLVLLIVFCIFAQVVRNAKSSEALKNKKPLRLIKILNYTVKVLFSATAVVLFAVASQNLHTLLRQNSNISKWEITKNYAVMGYTADDSIATDVKAAYEFDCKMQHFFRLLNEDGAILFAPSGYYTSSYDSNNDIPKYAPGQCTVSINNNYLKLNPIYDLNGNKVDVPEENTIGMTILVPEKYKGDISQIKKLYTDFITYYYYGFRDRYAVANGKHLDYDTYDEKQVVAHHDPLSLKVIFVKNNQEYFTYDPNVCKNTNNVIIDPIAMITNNNNAYLEDYQTYVSQQQLRAKISDYDNPLKCLSQFIEQAGLKDNIILVTSLYDKVGEYMHSIKNQIAIEISAMVISLFIVILIIIFSTFNYLEESKSINAVKRIHGFPFIKRHLNYLIYPIAFWSIIYFVILALCYAKILNILNVGAAALLMMTIEEAVTVIVLRVKETDKLKDILKGG